MSIIPENDTNGGQSDYDRGYEAGRADMAAEASRIFVSVLPAFQYRQYQERTGGTVRRLRLVESTGPKVGA